MHRHTALASSADRIFHPHPPPSHACACISTCIHRMCTYSTHAPCTHSQVAPDAQVPNALRQALQLVPLQPPAEAVASLTAHLRLHVYARMPMPCLLPCMHAPGLQAAMFVHMHTGQCTCMLHMQSSRPIVLALSSSLDIVLALTSSLQQPSLTCGGLSCLTLQCTLTATPATDPPP